ncbi:MAG: queuosine precursor transporter [Burkholderiales bacterium]|nr:queuosine precursor transporter [Burkholderiales bacterium]
MQQNNIAQYPRYLWFIQLSYTAVILLANWFDIRMIKIGSIETDAGTLIFPLTFILADLITEVYGYKFARRAIWTGFLFNFVFIAYSQLIIHLPSPSYAVETNTKFDDLLGFNARIIIASTISYLCSEPLNSFVMAKLKLKTNGGKMWLRFTLSTIVASLFDSFLFGTLAFYGTMPWSDLIIFNLTMWGIKVFVEICGLPLSLSLANKLKKAEGLDMYDVGTKFSLFSLEANYNSSNNHYK